MAHAGCENEFLATRLEALVNTPGQLSGAVISATAYDAQKEINRFEAEIELLRKALVQYGDRSRMSWASPELQPVIDAAFEAQNK